jgi:hypothetical protein
LVGAAATAPDASARRSQVVQVKLGSRVIGHFHSNSISVSGLQARSVGVRLLGATDMNGRAYQWTPYKWQR